MYAECRVLTCGGAFTSVGVGWRGMICRGDNEQVGALKKIGFLVPDFLAYSYCSASGLFAVYPLLA